MADSLLWSRYQEYVVRLANLGMELDPSHLRFNQSIFSQEQERITRALDNLRRLESGERVNASENRMVGHYWLRAPELAPNPELTREILDTREAVEGFAQKILSGALRTPTNKTFANLLLVGIGGSALGPQLIYSALGKKMQGLKTWFLDNTDPEGLFLTLSQIPELDRTLVLVVSKSGGTPETYNGQHFAWNYFEKQGIEPAGHFVAVTGVGSKLDKLAESGKWLARFPMWDWVGGRTSIWSAVGLLPAALQGIDISALLKGAAAMDIWGRNSDPRKNPSLMLALMWGYLAEWTGKKVMVVLPYKDRLSLLASYLQQLIMESLGKDSNLHGKQVQQGLSVFGNKGSTDQHSYVQQLREGVPNFFALFVNVLKDSEWEIESDLTEVESGISIGDYLHSFLIGTRSALYENGRESLSITLDRLTPESLGALLALFERAVSFYAAMIEVNAYDQPGVEAGKKSAAQVLELQKKILSLGIVEDGSSVEQAASKLGGDYDLLAVHEILRYLRANRA